MKSLMLVAAGVTAVCSLTSTAAAFKEPGHRAIEVAAYRALLRQTMPSGESPLQVLVDHGVLKPPSSPLPQPSEVLDSGYEMLLVESMVVQSHLADHLMERQLRADRQCFHFNARGAHLTLTDDKKEWGIPKGLVEDAYIECLGVVDALLRGILFDARASHEENTDIYALMHMLEDSYSDAHVARSGDFAAGKDGLHEQGDILFIKPWNLRTWARYFLAGVDSEPVYHHFASTHHMGSDTRDLGYLIGPTDEGYAEKAARNEYNERVAACLKEARALIRPKSSADAEKELRIDALYGDLVPPEKCLSDRALAAKEAITALLRLVADYVPHVVPPFGVVNPSVKKVKAVVRVAGKEAQSFEDAWTAYRQVYLLHRKPWLTKNMSMDVPTTRAEDGSVVLGDRVARKDRVYSGKALAPRQFKEAGFGLGVEVRGGTPLWLGLDTFLSRKSASHNRTIVLLDSLGWGLQARLPLENEIGERPVGIAFDIGPGLPVPLSELLSFDEVQIYAGARLRVAYTAQAIFKDETRHALEFGFGGIAIDAIVGNQAWLGLDLFRYTYYVDFWDGDASKWSPLTFGLSGGVAVDAL